MKLDPDCVRDVLLYLESNLEYVESANSEPKRSVRRSRTAAMRSRAAASQLLLANHPS